MLIFDLVKCRFVNFHILLIVISYLTVFVFLILFLYFYLSLCRIYFGFILFVLCLNFVLRLIVFRIN